MTMRNKKAYMLNEMILIIALLSVVMMLSVKPMQIFFRGVLGANRAFDQQSRLEIMLDQLRSDTENASFAFVQGADERLGGDLLYLSGPDGVACYQFADGAALCVKGNDTREWPLAKVEFEWRLLTLPGDGQALAITTQQRHERRRNDLPAFRGSQVFVVNLNNTFEAEEQ